MKYILSKKEVKHLEGKAYKKAQDEFFNALSLIIAGKSKVTVSGIINKEMAELLKSTDFVPTAPSETVK